MKQPLQSRRQTKLQKGEGRENPVKGERERKRERKQEKDSRVEEQVSKREREIWVRGWTGRNIDPTTSRQLPVLRYALPCFLSLFLSQHPQKEDTHSQVKDCCSLPYLCCCNFKSNGEKVGKIKRLMMRCKFEEEGYSEKVVRSRERDRGRVV